MARGRCERPAHGQRFHRSPPAGERCAPSCPLAARSGMASRRAHAGHAVRGTGVAQASAVHRRGRRDDRPGDRRERGDLQRAVSRRPPAAPFRGVRGPRDGLGAQPAPRSPDEHRLGRQFRDVAGREHGVRRSRRAHVVQSGDDRRWRARARRGRGDQPQLLPASPRRAPSGQGVPSGGGYAGRPPDRGPAQLRILAAPFWGRRGHPRRDASARWLRCCRGRRSSPVVSLRFSALVLQLHGHPGHLGTATV